MVSRCGGFIPSMSISPSTTARRAMMQEPLRRAICQGHALLAGVDEAGVGALAGPVVAAAVMIGPDRKELVLDGLDDSKRLTRRRREVMYDILVGLQGVTFSTAIVSAREVDDINVLNARLMAMTEAVTRLKPQPSLIFVDGNRLLPDIDLDLQEAVVGADATISVVAAASVIAKVTRDRLMSQQAHQFPLYGFERHVGYPTQGHLRALKTHGPCPIHRLTYKPVRACLPPEW